MSLNESIDNNGFPSSQSQQKDCQKNLQVFIRKTLKAS